MLLRLLKNKRTIAPSHSTNKRKPKELTPPRRPPGFFFAPPAFFLVFCVLFQQSLLGYLWGLERSIRDLDAIVRDHDPRGSWRVRQHLPRHGGHQCELSVHYHYHLPGVLSSVFPILVICASRVLVALVTIRYGTAAGFFRCDTYLIL